MTRRTRPQRGFILIVVLIVGVAALVTAIGLVTATGKYAEAVTHSVGGDQAMILAQSGMERTEAWVLRIAAMDPDFDRALDPALIPLGSGADAAACDFSISPTITPGVRTGVPEFSDGSIYTNANFMNGTRFRLVPFGGGAYLVHTEDNDDDRIQYALYSTATDNNPGTKGAGLFCSEGDTIFGANNWARDRDRAIWVTAVGIYPGTDPLLATHRATVRKLVINPAVPRPPAFLVGGNLSRSGSSTFIGSNSQGSVQAEGTITGSPSFCGSVQSNSASNNAISTGGCGANAFVRQTNIPVTPPSIHPVRDAAWWAFDSPCNVYIDPAVGMFYWDNSRGFCNNYVGATIPTPATYPFPMDPLTSPLQTADSDGDTVADYRSCWVPLILNDPDLVAPAVIDANLEMVANGSCWDWQPGPAPILPAPPITIPGMFRDGYAYPKPNWQLCPTSAAASFDWEGGNPVVPCDECIGTGVGAKTAIQFCNGANPGFTTNARAYPVVTILHVGNYSPPMDMGAPPATQMPRSAWPMVTFLVEGTLSLSGANSFWVGVGSRKGGYPSIVASSINEGGSGSFGAAGGVYAGVNTVGTWSRSGSGIARIYGPVQVSGNFSSGGSGSFTWDYDLDVTGGGGMTAIIPPIIMYPTNF